MTETEHMYANGFSPVKDGFEEQKVLLTQISRELDDYFCLRTLGSIRL